MRKFKNSVIYLFKNFQNRHRIDITDLLRDKVLLQIFISPARITTLSILALLLMLIAATLLISYTPILGSLPDHFGLKTRTLLIEKMKKLDSLETQLSTWNLYRENMIRAIDRLPPIIFNDTLAIDSTLSSQQIVERISADSMLRDTLLDPNNILHVLNSIDSISSRSLLEFFIPIDGTVNKEYDLSTNFRGIEFTVVGEKPVLAVMNGRVQLSIWSPSNGYIVQIQHSNGLLSTYSGLTSSLVNVGDNVEGGEAIGYIGEPSEESEKQPKTSQPLVVEFWQDGNSINPRNFLFF